MPLLSIHACSATDRERVLPGIYPCMSTHLPSIDGIGTGILLDSLRDGFFLTIPPHLPYNKRIPYEAGSFVFTQRAYSASSLLPYPWRTPCFHRPCNVPAITLRITGTNLGHLYRTLADCSTSNYRDNLVQSSSYATVAAP